MKKFVLVPDSFKGTLSSPEICKIVSEEIRYQYQEANIVSIPVADGGEGTTGALVEGLGGIYSCVQVTGPFGKPVIAQYGILGDGITAVMEMAEAE